jgi:phospholipase/carboxylesterase
MNRKYKIISIVLILFLSFGLIAYQETEEKQTYRKKLNDELRTVLDRGDYYRGIELLNEALEKLPENQYITTWLLAQFYATTMQYKSSMDILEYGHRKGIWYNFKAAGDTFAPIAKKERFKKILEKNEELKEEAQDKSEPKFEVIKPEGYKEDKKYPMVIALHGAAGSIRSMKSFFTSGLLEKEYLIAFFQSSQMIHSNGYHWENMSLARKEVKSLYEDVLDAYKVDEDRVILFGFSQGGAIAFDVSLNEIIPSIGFILFSPAKPKVYDLEKAVKRVQGKKISAVIITGENDYLLPGQKEMHRVFKEMGFVHKFTVIPKLGHDLPEDYKTRLEEAIRFVNENAKK